jgi:hypothetical protein
VIVCNGRDSMQHPSGRGAACWVDRSGMPFCFARLLRTKESCADVVKVWLSPAAAALQKAARLEGLSGQGIPGGLRLAKGSRPSMRSASALQGVIVIISNERS